MTSRDAFLAQKVFSPARASRAAFAKQVLLVTSGKGGVGKSTVAVNLASTLAQRDLKVGLLDADVYGPSVPRMLQVEDERLQWNENNRIVCAENFGIKVMSVGMTTPTADTPLIWRSSVASSAIIQLLDDVDWGPLEWLIVDMPPGTGDTQITLAQELPGARAVVVTTPQVVSTDDVRRALRMLNEVKVPIAGIIENLSGLPGPDGSVLPLFGEGGGQRLAEEYRVPLLGKIPIDIELRKACDAGMPLAVFGHETQKRWFSQICDALHKTYTAVQRPSIMMRTPTSLARPPAEPTNVVATKSAATLEVTRQSDFLSHFRH